MNSLKIYQCEILAAFMVVLFHQQILAKITEDSMPAPIYDCFQLMQNSSFYRSEPAELYAINCLSKYLWTVSGVQCQKNKTEVDEQNKYVQGLVGKLYKTRRKRQAGGYLVRKEYRLLSQRERNVYHTALRRLKASGQYDRLAGFHNSFVGGSAHGGPNFLGWHRIFLLLFEIALNSVSDEPIGVPFWDSTLENNMPDGGASSIMWDSDFLGTFDGQWSTPVGQLMRDVGQAGRPISDDEVETLMRIRSNEELYQILEATHNSVHVYTGGPMQELTLAAYDPVFFMHHCFVDYIWFQAQENMPIDQKWRYPDSSQFGHQAFDTMGNLKLQERELSNREGYSPRWTNEFYTYQRRPSCNQGDCGSPHLQCVRGWNGPTCAARQGQGQRWSQWRKKRDLYQHNIQPLAHVDPPKHLFKPIQDYPTDHISVAKETNPQEHIYPPKHILPLKNDFLTKHISPLKKDFLTKHISPLKKDYPPRQTSQPQQSQSSCRGKTVQNTFEIDCNSDIKQWAFLPIKVIHLRTDKTVYNSHVIKHGMARKSYDIYSESSKINSYIKQETQTCYKKCDIDPAGTSKVTVISFGLNYQGIYKEYLFLDNRQPVSSNMAYIGLRKPTKRKNTKVFLTAFDQCGRLCKPYCKVKRTGRYKPCSGALDLNTRAPRYYKNKYTDAVLQYWNLKGDLPVERRRKIYMIFYCDSKTKWWPWPGCTRNSHKYGR